ncbi:uncharacterized protein LOC143366437 [Andrena cerasifolii]|uniref:uncharacterized protein LOC143366437 n=1 Tax=Andrena cerasifolii TaxID=2819439 RepID=UPI004037F615
MDNFEINIELLITHVEGRPVLWDKTLDIYKDRNQTKKAWKEVCKKLKSNFEELSDTEKNSFSNEVAKKWTNVRDSFVKSNKRLKELRTCGVASFKPKKYVYSNQLQFLSKLIEERPAEDSLSESTCTDEGEINSDICATQFKELEKQLKSRKRRHDEFELKLIKALETSESQPNRHISFFNGIIPSLEKLDDDDVIKFQIGVLQLLENIKRSKQQNVCSQPPTLCRCSAINTVKCSF